MKRKTIINGEIIKLFNEINGGLKGYWSDSIRIDKMIIEANRCAKCWKSLKYKAFANPENYRAFGICVNCEYAKEFWFDNAAFAGYKKKICEAAAKTAARG